MAQAWFVRAGRDDEYAELDLGQGLIAVGWHLVSDLSSCHTKDAITKTVRASYPGVSGQTVTEYSIQLHVLRNIMEKGDLVILLRTNSPDVAIGEITGDYIYRPGPMANHARPVRWINAGVRRSEIGPELLDPPALSVIFRVNKSILLARLAELAGMKTPRPQKPKTVEDTTAPDVHVSAARETLTSNLNYARNLTSAGSHLEQLKVGLFEVPDVYRAAWVQAVAAIDHWVHQEVYDRMLRLSEDDKAPRPDRYQRFELSLGVLEQVQTGQLTKRAVLESELRAQLSFKTFQQPKSIQDAFGYVTDVADLWGRVAKILNEQSEVAASVSGKKIQDSLRDIVQRRN
ncbi:MAG TPA: hypothetical protein DGG94_02380, partial [Micromonosporaceae bacterium]|nr:hypothetical protein [Micromonosporaceae bacterium]